MVNPIKGILRGDVRYYCKLCKAKYPEFKDAEKCCKEKTMIRSTPVIPTDSYETPKDPEEFNEDEELKEEEIIEDEISPHIFDDE